MIRRVAMVRKSKLEAKDKIKNKVFNVFLTVLIVQFVISFVLSLFMSIPFFIKSGFSLDAILNRPQDWISFLKTVSSDNLLALLVFLFGSIGSLLAYPATIGQSLYFLNVADKGTERVSNFLQPYTNTIKIAIVMIGFSIIVAIGMLLLIIPGIYFALKYALLPQVLADRPELTIKETFEEAARLSKGNKGKILWFPFSFFFWLFIIAITFGLAMIYLIPYGSTAMARLYLNIKEEKTPKTEDTTQYASQYNEQYPY